MKSEAARLLVAELVAAFPFPTPPQATVALYQSELQRLQDEQAATGAVAELVRSARRLPPVADLLEAYRAKLRLQAPALPAWQQLAEEPWEPVPEEALAWLGTRGIDTDGLLRAMHLRAHAAPGTSTQQPPRGG